MMLEVSKSRRSLVLTESAEIFILLFSVAIIIVANHSGTSFQPTDRLASCQTGLISVQCLLLYLHRYSYFCSCNLLTILLLHLCMIQVPSHQVNFNILRILFTNTRRHETHHRFNFLRLCPHIQLIRIKNSRHRINPNPMNICCHCDPLNLQSLSKENNHSSIQQTIQLP